MSSAALRSSYMLTRLILSRRDSRETWMLPWIAFIWKCWSRQSSLLGFRFRHVAGVDMFVDAQKPQARSAIHLVFVGERVRPEYLEPIPGSPPVQTSRGILIAPVADLVMMKLTSFRLKDKVHIQDMDSVGLITPEIEAGLSEPLRARLTEVRATE